MTALSWVSLPLHLVTTHDAAAAKKVGFGEEELTGVTGLSSKGHFQIADLTPNIMTLAKVSCSIVYYGLVQKSNSSIKDQ